MTQAQRDSTRGWVTCAAGFASMFTVFGVAYSFGAFFRPMAEEFGSGRGATSLVFSITAFLYFTLGIVSGRAADRFGPRPVLLVGGLVMGGGLALTSVVDRLWLGYLTYGAGVGVGVACGYVPMVAVIGGWFERWRGAALGIGVSGIGIGTLAVAPLAGGLVDRYGWRRTYLLFGVGASIVLAVAAALAKKPPLPAGGGELALSDAVRTRSFASLYVSALLMSMALFVPFVFLPPFAEGEGASKVAAAALVGVIGGASTLGRLGIGALGDRLGRIRTYRACFLLMALSYPIWLATDAYPWLVVFAAVMGIGYGGFIALSPAVIADLFGLHGLGGLIGAAYTAAGFGALVGPPAAGALIDATGSFRVAIGMALILSAAAWAALLPLGRPVGATASPISSPGTTADDPDRR